MQHPPPAKKPPPVASLDTHFYDKDIRPAVDPFRPLIARLPARTAERQRIFAVLRSLITPLSPRALFWLNRIIADDHKPPNYEPQGDYYADDMLHLAGIAVLEKQLSLSLLVEQLEDIQGGRCQQGRAHRLFQLVRYITDWPLSLVLPPS